MSRRSWSPVVDLISRAIAEPYRDEVVADLIEDERQGIAAGRFRVGARLALYAQLIRSAIDSHVQRDVGEGLDDPNTGGALSGIVADFRMAWRLHRSRPGLTVIAVVTLALASGANTALFSAANAVLWRPLPFESPDRLVFLWDVTAAGAKQPLTPARALDFRQNRSLAGLALLSHRSFVVTGLGPAEEWRGASVSGNFFEVLGVQAVVGRTFHMREGSRDVVVLSHRLWRSRFHEDPSVVGRAVMMSGRPRVVLGVMGDEFYWPAITHEPGPVDPPLIWALADESDVPDAATRSGADFRLDRSTSYLRAVGRLAAGMDLDSARAEIAAVAARLARDHPATDANRTATLTPASDQLFGALRRPMLLLVASTLLVVLVAAANVANLLLVRLSGRARELAVRLALGATRARVIRQLAIEGLVLAVAGAAMGLVVAKLSFETIVRLAPNTIGRLDRLAIDPWPLMLAVVVTMATGLLLGVVPGLALARRDRRLSAGSRGDISSGRSRVRQGLVVIEVALALVLVIGAVLFGESLLRLR
ncbi:MAG TPA: FtsX-like permease family protein, partial [Vicinamibacterales bacterium]